MSTTETRAAATTRGRAPLSRIVLADARCVVPPPSPAAALTSRADGSAA